MTEYFNLNKEYNKDLTIKFLKEIADDSRDILQEEDLFLLDLDIVGIQINKMVYNEYIGKNNRKRFDFCIYLDFINQKFGECQQVFLFIDFINNEIDNIYISCTSDIGLCEEFKVVLPLLEKCLVNQLYILKKVIEETEEN